LKEAEILAERIKMLSIVEPYAGKYFSTDYIRTKILKQTEEEIKEINRQMDIDKEKLQKEQMAILAQQQAMAMQGMAPTEEQAPQ
jgi:hypothetical protein